MEPELSSLEDRIRTLVMLTQQLRQENGTLRQELLQSRGENRRLSEKIDSAKARLDAILKKLPEDETEQTE